MVLTVLAVAAAVLIETYWNVNIEVPETEEAEVES